MARRQPDLHVALLRPEIHWNTGNVGRTCLATGARLHLVSPLGFSLEAREVRRAGLDYWPRVRPCVWPDWRSFAAGLSELGEPLLFSPSASQTFWEIDYPQRPVLVFGGESRGLPRELLVAHEERLVRIPQRRESVRSLNLSTSVALAVYEVVRRRAATRYSPATAPFPSSSPSSTGSP